MFFKPAFTAIFTILILSQSALSTPLGASCGGPEDPPCSGIKKCCTITLSPTEGGSICLPECPA
ncbi:hypothetical protein FB451DRAFT_1561149 [Mycena latifolia]|nr:hypothetical protein FB451DRAFT_1561149 [Mycena latifolia]